MVLGEIKKLRKRVGKIKESLEHIPKEKEYKRLLEHRIEHEELRQEEKVLHKQECETQLYKLKKEYLMLMNELRGLLLDIRVRQIV